MLGALMTGGLAAAIANRAMDPLVTSLARDFGTPRADNSPWADFSRRACSA
jgi:hypothetical protein